MKKKPTHIAKKNLEGLTGSPEVLQEGEKDRVIANPAAGKTAPDSGRHPDVTESRRLRVQATRSRASADFLFN